MLRIPSSPECRARIALQLGLGFIWIYEGLVPKWIRPITEFEQEIVAASGLVPNNLFPIEPFLHVLGVLEAVLGVLVLLGVWQRPLCVLQAAIIGAFTIVIPLTAPPAILAHPFGLLTKNVPILGAIIALWFLAAPSGSVRDGACHSPGPN